MRVLIIANKFQRIGRALKNPTLYTSKQMISRGGMGCSASSATGLFGKSCNLCRKVRWDRIPLRMSVSSCFTLVFKGRACLVVGRIIFWYICGSCWLLITHRSIPGGPLGQKLPSPSTNMTDIPQYLRRRSSHRSIRQICHHTDTDTGTTEWPGRTWSPRFLFRRISFPSCWTEM